MFTEQNSYKATTPILRMDNYNQNELYIKRDDLIPFCFGGNKARKAVLFFDDIQDTRADCVVTYGSSSSNHCRTIANMAKKYGIPCYIISPLEVSEPTINSKLIDLFEAEVIRCTVSEVSNTIEEKLADLKLKGYSPYFIAGGGHGNIGTQAYVNCYFEIVKYEKLTRLHFDYIFFTCGTGTTQAGLICGQLINGDNRKIIGISNARRNPQGSQVVLACVNEYLSSFKRPLVTMDNVTVVDDYVLEGYGSYNNEIVNTIKEVLMAEGIPLDTTYTGKAFWGMKEYIKLNKIVDKRILFIHTGGTPLFFDDLEKHRI